MRLPCETEEDDLIVEVADTDQVHELRPARFETFYQQHHQAIYRPLALSLRNHALAAEATDEAFVRAYERWDQVREFANPQGWVYRVALNWARSRLRRRRFEVVVDPPEPGSSPAGFDPDLDRALAALPVVDRAVVILKHFAGWTYDEIGEALDLRAGTVKSRLHRIMSDLRRQLEVRS